MPCILNFSFAPISLSTIDKISSTVAPFLSSSSMALIIEPPVETTSSTITTELFEISGPSMDFLVPCFLSEDLTKKPFKLPLSK